MERSQNRVQLADSSSTAADFAGSRFLLFQGDVEDFLRKLPPKQIFNLIVTSPPYNIGKKYEKHQDFQEYLDWQTRIIKRVLPLLKKNGSICWQVGNYVENGSIWPLDLELAPIFRDLGLQMRNRIVWKFGHGLHSRRRFSGRYEVVLWFTANEKYKFNLDAVRVPAKYPGKRHYKGPKAGEYSGCVFRSKKATVSDEKGRPFGAKQATASE